MRRVDAPKITIAVLESADDASVAAFERLIPLLSTSAPVPDRDVVLRVLEHPANTVYAACADDGRILGLATLVTVELATGREARIEDVVVDESARGLGAGHALVTAALAGAAASGARHVDLTSAPRRVAARALYTKLGFAARDTGVFRHDLAGYRD
jgi:ribosomal protein S18 acetylase RimI-like enzyme